MEFQIIWFIVWGILWAVYFMLDGFDFGVGMLHPFLGKNHTEERVIINTIGPLWNGNEVWLITAGAATFAAFPATYAHMFSYLYSALLLILFSLILRGAALEFWGKVERASWRRVWGIGLFLGSLLPSLLFGVAFGNIFKGLPMDAGGYHGTLMSLLNPYGLLTGVLFVVLFLLHGSLWLITRTEETLAQRAANLAGKLWYIALVVAISFLICSGFETSLAVNYLSNYTLLVVPALAVLCLATIGFFSLKGHYGKAFYASCLTIVMVTFTGIIGLYPNLIPSSIDPNYSLTIFNSSSSVYTLKIMTVVVSIFLPVVISYQVWVYKVFHHKPKKDDVSEETTPY